MHNEVGTCTEIIPNKVPLSAIMENAGWSNAETFRKFYSRPVTPPRENYGQLLLENLQM